MPTVTMRAPTTGPYTQIVGMPSGTSYTPSTNGFVAAQLTDVPNFLAMGYIPFARRDNLTATTDPSATDDSSADYAAGSVWLNTTYGGHWTCVDATASAAKWVAGGGLVGRLLGANMNTTGDQQIPLFLGGSKVRFTKVSVKNASISLDTAAGGIYTAASKGGTALVANTQVYTGLTGNTLVLDLTLATTPGKTLFASTTALYFALTTAQGAAATADIYVYGDRSTAG